MPTDKNAQSEFSDGEWCRKPGSSSSPKLVHFRLVRCCTTLCPTWVGSFCLVATLLTLVDARVNYGESCLSQTHRLPADILAVEGWIGRKGLHGAVDQFERGGCRSIVASGGLASGRWEDQPSSYAQIAAAEIIRSGVPFENLTATFLVLHASHAATV
jgi:hypothetical protein